MQGCRNCGAQKLCRAHILPAAFGRLARGDGTDLHQISEMGGGTSKNGPWDEAILCSKCDGKLGVFDKYVVEIFRFWSNSNFELDQINCFENVKTGEIIRFAMAVLWRASISKKSQAAGVSLGPYEEKFRKTLFEDATLLNQVCVVIISYSSIKFPMHQFLEFPIRMRGNGESFYTFQLGQFRMLVKVGGNTATDAIKHFCLKESESKALVPVWDFDSSEELKGIVDLYKSSKRNKPR